MEGGPTPADGGTINAAGSARVAADEQLKLDVVAGNLSGAGTAAVGAAGSVPVVTKTTTAFVGDHTTLNAQGNDAPGLTVHTGAFQVTETDTRFDPVTAVEADHLTLNLGYVHGLAEGQQVLYDNGGGANIAGLTGGSTYFVHVVSPTEVQLSATQGGPAISITAPTGGGESQRLVPTNQAGVRQDGSPRFDPAKDVNRDGQHPNEIALPYTLTVNTGDPVVYSSGGGAPIGGLTDGATYYAVVDGAYLGLAASACQATGTCGKQEIALDATQATGRSHSIVKQGTLPSGDAAPESGTHTITASTAAGFKGLAVTATNSDDIGSVGVSAALSGSVSVGVSGAVGLVTSSTAAF